MCGIAGIVDSRGVPGRDVLEAARDTLAHRGPDDAGLYINGSRDAALLFRRLSIIDLSPAGHQPLENEDGSRWIVFNGEIYNFEALRDVLESAGHRFRSRTDSEVILHAFEEWGPRAIDRFIGMFAFAIWDEQTRTLFAARDRLGIKPLYYHHTPTGIRFASELKPLVVLSGSRQRVDPAAVWGYLTRGYIASPRTIYEGIRSLPPGHYLYWSADSRAVRVQRYWDPLWAYESGRRGQGVQRSDLSDACDELDAALRSSVKLRMRSDVPIGAFLSGGLDSSTVVAVMAAVADTRVKTFNIGFREREYDEAESAKRIAEHLGTEHHELVATDQQLLEFIPRLVDYFDEPFADSSALPTYLVSLLARQHVTVALSGDGGDELLGGYQHYRTIAARLRYARAIPVPMGQMLARIGGAFPSSRAKTALASLDALESSEEFFDYFTSVYRPHELRCLAPELTPVPDMPASRLGGEATDLQRFTLSDLQRYLPHDILTKVDRASMAVSLEARVPLLDHRVVELLIGLPDEMKVHDGTQKVLLRHVLARYVPSHLTDRPKKGFGVPLDEWLRGPLKWMLDEYLAPSRLRNGGLFDPAAVQSVIARFLRGEIGHTRPWVLLVYQMWAQRFGAN